MSPFLSHLRAIDGLELTPDFPLRKLTSLKVGGSALALATVHTPNALTQLVEKCRTEGVKAHLLGGGTNLLISNNVASRLVIRLGSDIVGESASDEGDFWKVSVSSAKPLASLVALAKSHRCLGYAALAGIPGTVGGAVAMNAGTKNGDVSHFLESVIVAGAEGEGVLSRETLQFSYRSTSLPKGAVVLGATFRFPKGSDADVESEAQRHTDSLARRKSTQPKGASAGCTFVNPPQRAAGALIDQCGLKGAHEGDAYVSHVHANFIVNEDQASSRDVLRLIRRVQDEVHRRFGITLTPEIRCLGDFDEDELPVGGKCVENLSQWPNGAEQPLPNRGQ